MKILTVISNFNEEKEIQNCIRDFRENAGIKSDLLIIDNWSLDSSIQLIKQSGEDYLLHPVNTGGSSGVIKTSLLYAYLRDYDVYCHMDGDNQHDASELRKLLAPIENNEADMVIGSRFIKREGFQSLFFRRVGIRIFSNLVSWAARQPITDLTSGFRAYNRKAIELFGKKFRHELDAVVQMLLIASYAHLRIREVPVVMRPRLTGKSEINFVNALKFPVYALVHLVGTMLQKQNIRKQLA